MLSMNRGCQTIALPVPIRSRGSLRSSICLMLHTIHLGNINTFNLGMNLINLRQFLLSVSPAVFPQIAG